MASDPLWGVGCGWAFQSAGWLADEAGPALAGARDLDAALDRYRRVHRRRLGPHHFVIADLGRAPAPRTPSSGDVPAAAHDETILRMLRGRRQPAQVTGQPVQAGRLRARGSVRNPPVSGAIGEVLRVRSADGSEIGCEVLGEGPPLLVIHGTISDRGRWFSVRDELAGRFRLHLMDRRGRGLSAAEVLPYTLEREGEDIQALIEGIGEPTLVLSHSYGGTCALEAAESFDGIARLLVYEPAFALGDPVFPRAALAEVIEALARDDREAAVTLFYRHALELDEDTIDRLRASPIWKARLAAADTLGREATAANAYRLDPERLATISRPDPLPARHRDRSAPPALDPRRPRGHARQRAGGPPRPRPHRDGGRPGDVRGAGGGLAGTGTMIRVRSV